MPLDLQEEELPATFACCTVGLTRTLGIFRKLLPSSLMHRIPSTSEVTFEVYGAMQFCCMVDNALTTIGTTPTEYMGSLMAATHSVLFSCCSSPVLKCPSAVDAPHATSAARSK